MIDFAKLSTLASELNPETPSTSPFWTDPHIAPILLREHLNPDTDAASRRPEMIEATISWIESVAISGPSRILDLGCGPGLYAERLARRGHAVRGIDFSENSLSHARGSARAAGLDIEYVQGDYTEIEFGTGFDLCMMIYCDLGALAPAARSLVMRKARAALKDGGYFVFDVFNEDFPATVKYGKSWSLHASGFWSARPHLALEDIRHFEDLQMVQRATLVAEAESGRVERYMIRDYYFSVADIRALVSESGFSSCELRRGLLPRGNFGEGEPVFAAARA
jgi:SAM-dependent methyltransferase